MQYRALTVGYAAFALTWAAGAAAQRPTAQRPVASRVPALPSVVGLAANSATAVLERLKLSVARRDSSTNDAPGGQVIRQEPDSGTPLRRVKGVTICVATPMAGPQRTTVVPELAGR